MASDAQDNRDDPIGPLLAANDPPPVVRVNPEGASSFLLIGDHAGNAIPAALGTLGLGEADRHRHIAWDIGVGGLGELLAARLDAAFIRQSYSRLVIDCNRAPDAPDAMPEVSDATIVPGNRALSLGHRAQRVAGIHTPYQAAIGAALAARDAAGVRSTLVSLHSFTPVMRETARPWHVGVLHHAGDPSFAQALLMALRVHPDLTVGDNEPYRMDLIDYTVPRHAYEAKRPYAEIEIRQDLIADATGQARWCATLADALTAAHETQPG